MRWLTREGALIDRVACPWLIRRFVDRSPEFVFGPEARLGEMARDLGATLYDVHDPSVELTHKGERCSFDAFLSRYALDEPALQRLALIVRGADTNRLDLAPQCAGLLAISQGMRALAATDHDMLERTWPVYDALYAWAKAQAWPVHTWERSG